MSYRPYPDADRARHQLDRHDNETPPLSDGSEEAGTFAAPRILISDEVREAMGALLASVGASLRAAFERPVGSEETTA
jgi:heme oxygenase